MGGRTDCEPIRRDDMAFLFHLEVYRDPKGDLCLVRGTKGTIRALIPRITPIEPRELD